MKADCGSHITIRFSLTEKFASLGIGSEKSDNADSNLIFNAQNPRMLNILCGLYEIFVNMGIVSKFVLNTGAKCAPYGEMQLTTCVTQRNQ